MDGRSKSAAAVMAVAVAEAVAAAVRALVAALVALPLAAVRSARERQSLGDLPDLPATPLAIGVTSAELLSAASITTIIRMTIPTPTMIPPSIPLPLLSLEEAAAGC
jgi:hypothetical protein